MESVSVTLDLLVNSMALLSLLNNINYSPVCSTLASLEDYCLKNNKQLT